MSKFDNIVFEDEDLRVLVASDEDLDQLASEDATGK